MIKLEGMEQLIKKIESLGEKAEDVKKNSVMAGAEIIEKAAKENVSKTFERGTGELEDNIQTFGYKDGEVSIGIPSGRHDGYHGLFLELGRSSGPYKKREGNYPSMPARPWLAPALENEKTKVEKAMAEEAMRGLGL